MEQLVRVSGNFGEQMFARKCKYYVYVGRVCRRILKGFLSIEPLLLFFCNYRGMC